MGDLDAIEMCMNIRIAYLEDPQYRRYDDASEARIAAFKTVLDDIKRIRGGL